MVKPPEDEKNQHGPVNEKGKHRQQLAVNESSASSDTAGDNQHIKDTIPQQDTSSIAGRKRIEGIATENHADTNLTQAQNRIRERRNRLGNNTPIIEDIAPENNSAIVVDDPSPSLTEAADTNSTQAMDLPPPAGTQDPVPSGDPADFMSGQDTVELTAHIVDEDEENRIVQQAKQDIVDGAALAEAVDERDIKRRRTALFTSLAVATIVIIVLAVTLSTSGESPPPSCDVEATIECTTLDGRSCEGIGPPTITICETLGTERGDGMKVLELSYQGGTCNSSSHQQGSHASCVDEIPPLSDDEEVTIDCSVYSEGLVRYESCLSCCVGEVSRQINVVADRAKKGDVIVLTLC